MRIFLTLIRLLTIFVHGFAFSISAPESCGGNRTVIHASALFGPKLANANVLNAHIFAPRPQADGAYIVITPAVKSFQNIRSSISSSRQFRQSISPQHVRITNLLARIFARPNELFRTHLSTSNAVTAETAPHPVNRISDLVSKTDTITFPNDMKRSPNLSKKQKEQQSLTPNENIQFSDAQHNLDIDSLKLPDGEKTSSTIIQPLFNACTQLSVPSDIRAMKGNVAVVTRGVCDFSTKVLNMQEAGAIGVIVVNSPNSSRLRHMKLNDSLREPPIINIPAVMINYKTWASIASCQNETTVSLTVDGEASFDIDYGREALNWAMMRGVALWILCQCGVNVVRHKRRTSESRARADAIAALPVQTYSRHQGGMEPDSDQLESVSPETIIENPPEHIVSNKSNQTPMATSYVRRLHDNEAISHGRESISESDEPSMQVEETEISGPSNIHQLSGLDQHEELESSDSEDPVCAICLDLFQDGEEVRVLPCSHMYHKKCIDPWFQSSSNCCPLCKREVPDLPPLTTHLQYGSMIV